MNLEIHPLDHSIPFDDESVIILAIDNQRLYRELIESFVQTLRGETAPIIMQLYEAGECLVLEKELLLITDVFSFDFKQRTLVTKIYKQLEKRYHVSKEADIIDQKIVELRSLIVDQLQGSLIELTVDDATSLANIYKMFNLRIDIEETTMLQRLLAVIDVIAELALVRVLVLNNIRSYFNENELIELYKYALYQKVNLLLIEPHHQAKAIRYEKTLHIDEDYVEFWC